MNEQLDLLIEQARSVHDLPTPTMSYQDCTLNFRKWQEEGSRFGLGMFDDDDRREPPMVTRVECSLPFSAGIMEKHKQYGVERDRTFTIYGEATDRSAGDVINRWLERKDYRFKDADGKDMLGKETPAGKWILAHAAEMNSARRIWDARRKHNDCVSLKHQIEELQERLRIEQLNLSVKVIEAAEDRNFTAEEKKVKLKELGAQDKDL